MRNVSDKLAAEIKTQFHNFVFFNRAVYEKMWKNIAQPDRPQMTVRRMRISHWIPKATNTHSRNM
jgi:hypothetical protein